MATTRKLAELFRAIATEDLGGASAVAAQICKNEEHKGHRSAARLLRGALVANGISPTNGHSKQNLPPANGTVLLHAALVRLETDRKLDDVVLLPEARRELDSVILEWQKRARLNALGIAPRSKLLFHGPPGCGKSLTARALGHELRLPVFLVRFDAIIGAYLGQTAIHLRQLFHFAESTPCVLLLDELDALGKRRGNPLDVGELDRIVIALMQELEHSRPAGVIVGTSNLPKNLDDALWRRFDLAVTFPSPRQPALLRFAKKIASERRVTLPSRVIRQAAKADSFAAAEAVVTAEIRQQAIFNG